MGNCDSRTVSISKLRISNYKVMPVQGIIENFTFSALSPEDLGRVEHSWRCIYDKTFPSTEYLERIENGSISYLSTLVWCVAEFYADLAVSLPVI